jgi:hypothetical protein
MENRRLDGSRRRLKGRRKVDEGSQGSGGTGRNTRERVESE